MALRSDATRVGTLVITGCIGESRAQGKGESSREEAQSEGGGGGEANYSRSSEPQPELSDTSCVLGAQSSWGGRARSKRIYGACAGECDRIDCLRFDGSSLYSTTSLDV